MKPINNIQTTTYEKQQQADHKQVEKELLIRAFPREPLVLSISYNTDLMAFENILPITRSWINFANKKSDLIIEVRTKSSLFSSLSDLKPSNKIIFSWTLSPERIVRMNEFDTPTLERRLSSIQLAISKGWKIRLCLIEDNNFLLLNFFHYLHF